MNIRISSALFVDADTLFDLVSRPETLFTIARPIIVFEARSPKDISGYWEEHWKYMLHMKLFGMIPMGEHTICIEEMDKAVRTIRTKETDNIASVWNHTITVETSVKGESVYTDALEIKAGFLSPFVWVFAQCFYRYRQRRLKLLCTQTETKTPT